MPQNGIHHPGITALVESFACNKNLKVKLLAHSPVIVSVIDSSASNLILCFSFFQVSLIMRN